MDRGQSFGNQEVMTTFMDNGTSGKTVNINNNNNNSSIKINNNNNNNNNNNLLVPGSTTQKTISAVEVNCGSSPGIDTSRRQDYDLDLVSYTGMHALPMTLTGSDVMSDVECPEFLLPVEAFFFSGFQCLEEIAGGSTVAIDNKIEQAMDLVKRHLMYAVREEVEILKQQIGEMMERIGQLEYENSVLRSEAKPETLNKLQIPRVTQPPQPALPGQPGQPATMVVAATPQQPQQSVTQPPAASQPATQVQPPQQSLQQPPPPQQQQQPQQQQHTSSSQAGQPSAT